MHEPAALIEFAMFWYLLLLVTPVLAAAAFLFEPMLDAAAGLYDWLRSREASGK